MKVMLMTLPKEGQTKDFTTPKFYFENPVRYVPMGILAVATSISAKHEVWILDADSWNLSIGETIEKIHEFAPDVLGISAVTRKAFAMSEILKRVDASIIKAVGGPHVTHYARETMALGADIVFQHDGDRNFSAWIDNGGRQKGIYWDYIQDMNSLPFIRRDFPGFKLNDYMLNEADAKKTMFSTSDKGSSAKLVVMFSSKGCPFRCVFCDVQDKKFRSFSPKKIVDEMENILTSGANFIHILDDCFNIDRRRVVEVCNEIERRQLEFSWSCRGRATPDEDVIIALKSAGCVRIHAGIESLNPEVLKWMNKKITVDAVEKFCALCHKYGIEIVSYFVLGAPMETREYREKLPYMIQELGIKYPYFNILYPSANTKYYHDLMTDGTYEVDHWQEFAENPVRDFEIPLPRSQELQNELEKTAEKCIKMFF